MLIVLHQEHSTPGRVGRLIAERGHALDIRRPRFGDPLPLTMQGHAGAVIFGGPMSANDPDDFVKAEIDWIGVCLKEDAPFLGPSDELERGIPGARRVTIPDAAHSPQLENPAPWFDAIRTHLERVRAAS